MQNGCETTLQSCNNIPLGYQGLLVSGQGGEGLGKQIEIELGKGGSIHAVSGCPFLGLGTLDLADPKGLLLEASFPR